MANYRAVANGNWSSGATWGGGAVPPNGQGHDIYTNNFAVTIDQNVNVNLLTNASNSGTFVGGGTATAGGNFTLSNGVVINANINGAIANTSAVFLTGTNTATINGNINLTVTGGSSAAITHSSSQGLTITGNISYTSLSANNNTILISGAGSLTHSGTITGATVSGNTINISSSGSFISTNSIINAGSAGPAITCGTSGSISVNNSVLTATNGASAISSSGSNRISGTFVNAANGQQAIYSSRYILNTTPTASYIQHALDGINANSFVRFYTADNTGLGPATTDVRSGISYGGGLVGTCAVPAAGSVAAGVPIDNTVGTATLTAANVRAALGMASANLDTQLAAIPTAVTNANAVRTNLATELGRIDATISSRSTLTAANVRTELTPELTQVTEVHKIHGLDIANALTVTPTLRSAGAITQAITGDGTTNTIVTRV